MRLRILLSGGVMLWPFSTSSLNRLKRGITSNPGLNKARLAASEKIGTLAAWHRGLGYAGKH